MAVSQKKKKPDRGQRTLEAMVSIYCQSTHGGESVPCEECTELLVYALIRLENCPWGENKPTCAKCAIHCYRPEKREAIRRVMRYSGPRMLFRHPSLALAHLYDTLMSGRRMRVGKHIDIRDT